METCQPAPILRESKSQTYRPLPSPSAVHDETSSSVHGSWVPGLRPEASTGCFRKVTCCVFLHGAFAGATSLFLMPKRPFLKTGHQHRGPDSGSESPGGAGGEYLAVVPLWGPGHDFLGPHLCRSLSLCACAGRGGTDPAGLWEEVGHSHVEPCLAEDLGSAPSGGGPSHRASLTPTWVSLPFSPTSRGAAQLAPGSSGGLWGPHTPDCPDSPWPCPLECLAPGLAPLPEFETWQSLKMLQPAHSFAPHPWGHPLGSITPQLSPGIGKLLLRLAV